MVRVQALILCAALLAAPILAHGAINAADSPAESVAAGTAAAAAADPCAAVACGDHGACVDGGCMCVDGFGGTMCETAPDPCLYPAPVFCDVGQHCVAGNCSGIPGHQAAEGVHCGGVVCAHGKCQFGACDCEPGFSGAKCDDPDECASKPCQNGATCLQSGDAVEDLRARWQGIYSCACAAGYSGTECQCPDCGVHGECNAKLAKCDCHSGYAGAECQTDVDECASTPCKNGATCTQGVDAYSCACAAGFTGSDCGVRPSACASAPCEHGGTCEERQATAAAAGEVGFSCSCAVGFAGEGGRCERDVDECHVTGDAGRSPCSNGATCRESSSSSSGAAAVPPGQCVSGPRPNSRFVMGMVWGKFASVVRTALRSGKVRCFHRENSTHIDNCDVLPWESTPHAPFLARRIVAIQKAGQLPD